MSDFPQLGSRLLVIYDGHCGFCNRSVRWFLRRDRNDRVRVIPSESPRVAGLLARHGLAAFDSPPAVNTVVVARNPGGPDEQIHFRSDAAIVLLAALPAPWPVFGILMRCVPRLLRDLGYRFIARIRYRIWGRYETCPLPTPDERSRFL